jgi:hypothetical protein
VATAFDGLTADLYRMTDFAVTVTYTPAGGSPTPVTVLLGGEDQLAMLGGTAVEQDVQLFQVRMSELPTKPKRGDLLSAYLGASWWVAEPGERVAGSAEWQFKAARRP